MCDESPAGQPGPLVESQCAVSVTHSLKTEEIQGWPDRASFHGADGGPRPWPTPSPLPVKRAICEQAMLLSKQNINLGTERCYQGPMNSDSWRW